MEQLMQMYGFCDSDVQLLTKEYTRLLKLSLLFDLIYRQFLMPGFVDAHVHAAQCQVNRPMEKGETLIEWLKKCVYTLEEQFKNTAFARNVYDEIVVSNK